MGGNRHGNKDPGLQSKDGPQDSAGEDAFSREVSASASPKRRCSEHPPRGAERTLGELRLAECALRTPVLVAMMTAWRAKPQMGCEIGPEPSTETTIEQRLAAHRITAGLTEKWASDTLYVWTF